MPQLHKRQEALDLYRKRAGLYDLELAAFEPIRRAAIARLQLEAGATVLDVGCGTGLSFALVQQAIGPGGRIVGIEQCPEMLARARERVSSHDWTNVTLLNAPAEAAKIPCRADAALFHFTHDILRNGAAVRNVVRHLKPGAHVVAAGLCWAQPLAWPVNCLVLVAALHSVTSLEGLEQPWSLLGEHLGLMDVSTNLFGGVYIASAVLSR